MAEGAGDHSSHARARSLQAAVLVVPLVVGFVLGWAGRKNSLLPEVFPLRVLQGSTLIPRLRIVLRREAHPLTTDYRFAGGTYPRDSARPPAPAMLADPLLHFAEPPGH